MLRLPVFQTSRPKTLAELVAALSAPGAHVIAGGTDLLPNLKHRLHEPKLLVSIDQVEELRHITWDEDAGVLRIGAGITLAEIAADNEIAANLPSLAKAAGLVASPLIRNMGTIGGNVNLDTRCRYVNQSEFWRSSIGGCLKSEGDVCHVVPKGRSCVAAMSSDCVPVLISLGASLLQVGPDGEREVPMDEYYSTDGIQHTLKKAGEVTAEIRVPLGARDALSMYQKWTVRKSIDFPLVSIAASFVLAESDEASGDSSKGDRNGHKNGPKNGPGRRDYLIREARVCLGVLAAKPKLLRADSLHGMSIASPETADALGELCFKQGKTLPNVPYEPEYRRKMLKVFARRGLQELL